MYQKKINQSAASLLVLYHIQSRITGYNSTIIYATADEAVAYMFYRCFFSVFFLLLFPSAKNTRQPFSGTAERIFMKLLPGKMDFATSCRRLANDSKLVYAGSVLYGGCAKKA